ncbi:hypothetical protein F2P56_037152, partial [Juglans regia]
MTSDGEDSVSSHTSHRMINPSDDSSSPYYLHPSDNPGALLVSEIFTGDNYIAWSRSITIALTVKNKAVFIDGTILAPPVNQSILHTAWLRANNLVLSWLMNSISKDIRNSLLYVASAVDLWKELTTRYLRSDGPRVFELEKSLSSITQDSLSITEYFSSFKTLWDEYINYRPFPTCSCGKMATCTCNLFDFLLIRQQSDYVLKFLVGLNDSYASIRSQLLMVSPLPSMAKVFSLLLQEESQRQLNNSVSNETHALLAKQTTQTFVPSKFSKDKQKRSSLYCTHCGYNGHTIEKCFQLHGYPPGWTGPKGKRNPPAAHAATSTSELYIQTSNDNQKFSLTAEEFHKLLALANSNSSQISTQTTSPAVNIVTSQIFGKSSNPCYSVSSSLQHVSSWILDIGATDHMDQSTKKMIGIAFEKHGLYYLSQAISKDVA